MEIVLFLLVLLATILSAVTCINSKRRDTRVDLLAQRLCGKLNTSVYSSLKDNVVQLNTRVNSLERLPEKKTAPKQKTRRNKTKPAQ